MIENSTDRQSIEGTHGDDTMSIQNLNSNQDESLEYQDQTFENSSFDQDQLKAPWAPV